MYGLHHHGTYIDGNSDHIAYVWKKTGPFWKEFQISERFWSEQSQRDQITEITPQVRVISELPSNISTLQFKNCMIKIEFLRQKNHT